MIVKKSNLTYLSSTLNNRYILCKKQNCLTVFDTQDNKITDTEINYCQDALYAFSLKHNCITECSLCGEKNRIKIYDIKTASVVYDECNNFGINTDNGHIVSFFDSKDDLIIVTESLNGRESYWICAFCLNYSDHSISLIKKIDKETLFNISFSDTSVLFLETSKIYSNEHYLHQINTKNGKSSTINLNLLNEKGWIEQSLQIDQSATHFIGTPNVGLFKEYSLIVAKLHPFEIVHTIPLGIRNRAQAAETQSFWMDTDTFCVDTKEHFHIYQLDSCKLMLSIEKSKSGITPVLSTSCTDEQTLWVFE